MISAAFFYVFAATMILSAGMVVAARNPVHAVLFLILTFFNAAGLFIMLGAEFIAMMLVIVYVGAVAVLFLFVVMMLNVNAARLRKSMGKHIPVGIFVGSVLLAELVWVIRAGGGEYRAAKTAPIPDAAVTSNTHAIGEVLYTQFALLFQLSGLILLVAMIGAITLTLRHRPGVKRQDIAQQVNRKASDVLKVEKITTGAGVS